MKIRCTQSGIGVDSGTIWPVLQDTKMYWIAVICGVEKKIIKSTGFFAGAPKNGPSFELVTVTENQLDLIPQSRPRGRPSTGSALTPAQKQARYRARKSQKTVTVTLNREHFEHLDTFIRGVRQGHSMDLTPDSLDAIYRAIRNAAFYQLPKPQS
jgi:hypothetical protein